MKRHYDKSLETFIFISSIDKYQLFLTRNYKSTLISQFFHLQEGALPSSVTL